MAAAQHNITVATGEDFGFTLTIQDSADNPVDITGDTFTAEVRRAAGKPLAATFTCTITNAANGVLSVQLPNTETAKLKARTNYKWDLFRTENVSGDVTQLLFGDVLVRHNITDL